MRKSNINAWKYPYRPAYYLTHPWKFIAQTGRNIRSSYMRVRYGWCYSDVWDWDQWFMHTVPDMFRHLAKYGCAYPGHPPFDTPEKWREWLNEMADLIETGREDWQDEHNEYYDEWVSTFGDEKHEEVRLKYIRRVEELSKQGKKNIGFALSQISEHFYNLWD